MKVKIPAKTVEACDICHDEAGAFGLIKCVVCSAEFCYSCRPVVAGCVVPVVVCSPCVKTGVLDTVIDRYARKLNALLNLRERELKKRRWSVLVAKRRMKDKP